MYIVIKEINIKLSKKKNSFLFFRNLQNHLVKMIIKFCNIYIRMFIDTAINNVNYFSINYFNECGFYLSFFKMLRSHRGLCESRLEI